MKVAPAMQALALAAVLLGHAAAATPALALAPAPAPAEVAPPADPTSVTVDIGSRRVVLPAPAGWVELTTNRELVRSVLEASLPDDSRHLATYAPPEEVAHVDAAEDMRYWGTALTNRALEQRGMSSAEFLQLRVVVRQQWTKVVEAVRKRVADDNAKVSKRLKADFDVDMEGAGDEISSLGVFLDEPGAIGAVLIVGGGTVEGEPIEDVALAIVMVHVGMRLVGLNVYRSGTAPEDFEAVKSVALAWKDSVRAANPEPGEKPEPPPSPPADTPP